MKKMLPKMQGIVPTFRVFQIHSRSLGVLSPLSFAVSPLWPLPPRSEDEGQGRGQSHSQDRRASL